LSPYNNSVIKGFHSTDLIYPAIKKIVISKLEGVLDTKLNLTLGTYLKEFKPFGIHTDYVKGDKNPGLAILVPLNKEPLDTSTVIFNEECTSTFADFQKEHTKLQNNARHLAQSLMSHEPVNKLEYVSLLAVAHWEPGSVIAWDRRLLHSSDNFLANNVKEKRALVLFFNND